MTEEKIICDCGSEMELYAEWEHYGETMLKDYECTKCGAIKGVKMI